MLDFWGVLLDFGWLCLLFICLIALVLTCAALTWSLLLFDAWDAFGFGFVCNCGFWLVWLLTWRERGGCLAVWLVLCIGW